MFSLQQLRKDSKKKKKRETLSCRRGCGCAKRVKLISGLLSAATPVLVFVEHSVLAGQPQSDLSLFSF